ncbi:uncharacterized protein LOC122073285 isoform X2 [Macadamia integrifolia]|uniref:uncharacterized protein LOC122073285 isoform X2 n=1 Tax=Macadamia integrifolia TaxID=60698 RepID=UPI001C4FA421|nr:uncharacterized protein LOC122073285 isoform X2 [Macadamia integrifolia]
MGSKITDVVSERRLPLLIVSLAFPANSSEPEHNLRSRGNLFPIRRADEEPVDPKKYLEETCKPKCVKPLLEYQISILLFLHFMLFELCD